jgi:acetyl esterase
VSAEIDPDMLPILEAMRAAPAVDYPALPIEEARAMFNRGVAPWAALAPQNLVIDELSIPGATAPMRARLYRPRRERLPLIVFVHGGGWTFGSVDSHENETRYLALASGAAVLGFDYRLSPECPFPGPLDDVLAALAAIRGGALGETVDATRLAIAGDSAGANLALGAMLALREAGLPMPAVAGLFYGCYAPRFDTESHGLFGDGQFGLSTERMRWYWGNFLGTSFAAPPGHAAPLGASLAGLPPLYLMAAGLDPLRDDTLALAEAAVAQGAAHQLLTVPGVIHGFLGRTPRLPVAQRALAEAGAFIADKL